MAGGKKKAAVAKPKGEIAPEIVEQVASLKTNADKHFLTKDYTKANEVYEQAIKLLPDGPEKGDLLQKTACVYLISKRYKEAIKACNATLDLQPTSTAIMKTRAKAYEGLQHYKQALADIQTVNKGDGASNETREMEQRLRDTMSAIKAKLSATSGQQSAPRAPTPKTSFPYTITVKATLGNETRVLTASLLVSYAELYQAIKAKFPSAGPFLLKYIDKEGDNVTITSRNDVQAYLGDIMTAYQKQMAGGPNGPKLGNQLPPMRVQLIRVNSEAEVPKPPADETPHQPGQKEEPQQQEYEADEWLVEFARMFSEVTGIDPIAHHEHLNLGHERIARAVDTSLSDDKALPLFDKALEHFREATCGSIIQWGNVFIIKADRQAQNLLRAGKPVEGKAVDAMLKEYDESEKKFNEALKIKPDSWEAHGSMGQLEWERAKAKMSYVISAPPVEDLSKEGADTSKADAAAAVKDALAKLDAKKVAGVQKHMDNVNKWFEKALALAKTTEERKKKEEEEESEEKDAKKEEMTPELKQQQQMQSPSGNMLVMHGNILYEWSQVMAAINKDWKPILDSAVTKFRGAGAPESDVRGALKNHSMKDQLDLGPDPEPVTPDEPQEKAQAPEAKAPEAKGLPSLEVKKKKGT